MMTSVFVNCTKCGKKLIEKRQDGLWHFCFGKPSSEEKNMPVEMYIFGSIRIKCLRKSCNEWNNLSHFPEK